MAQGRAVDGMKSPSRDRIGTSPQDTKNRFPEQEKSTYWRCNKNKGYISQAANIRLFEWLVQSYSFVNYLSESF
jgi:hypothetical protein